MEMIKIVALGVLGTFLALVLKEQKPFLGIALAILTATAVLLLAFPRLSEITVYAKTLYRAAGGRDFYLDSILKITGIACLARIGSDICKDAGLTAVSSAIGMAGRLICICICLPSVGALFEFLTAILPG